MPFDVAQSSGCRLRGQSCCVEITLGCSSKCSDKTLESIGNQNKNAVHHHSDEAQMVSIGRSQLKQGPQDQFAFLQRTFIYQPGTVLVPLMHRAFARSSLRRYPFLQPNTSEAASLLSLFLVFRFCRKNPSGTSLSERWPLWSFSRSSHVEHWSVLIFY